MGKYGSTCSCGGGISEESVQRLAPSGGGGVPKSIDKEKNCSYEGHL